MKVLNAQPGEPIQNLVPARDIASNQSVLAGKTAGDIISWASHRLQQAQQRGYASGGVAGRKGYLGGGAPDLSDAGVDLGEDDTNYAPAPAGATAQPPDTSPGPDTSQGPDIGGASANATYTATPGVGGGTVAPPASTSGGLGDAVSSMGGKTLEALKKPENFIPLLTGIAAWAGAPTQHPLVALAQGLGAGATAYQGQRQFGLEQGKLDVSKGQLGVEQQLAAQRGALVPSEIAHNYASLAPYYKSTLTGPNRWLPTLNVDKNGNYLYRDALGKIPGELTADQTRQEDFRVMGSVIPGINNAVAPSSSGNTAPPANVGGNNPGAGGTQPVAAGPVAGGAPAPGGSAPVAGAGNDPSVGDPVADLLSSIKPRAPQAATSSARPAGIPALDPNDPIDRMIGAGAFRTQFRTPPTVNEDDFPLTQSPGGLTRLENAATEAGDTAAAREFAHERELILSGARPSIDKNKQPHWDFANQQAVAQTNQQRVADNQRISNDLQTHGQEFLSGAQRLTQALDDYDKAGQGIFLTGPTDLIAHLTANARALSLDKLVPEQFKQFQDAADKQDKDQAYIAYGNALNAASGALSHAPATLLGNFHRQFPTSDKGPGAKRDMSVYLHAQIDQNTELYRKRETPGRAL